MGTLLAGIDPVAIDYYAGKHLLYPLSTNDRHYPDTPGDFRAYLVSAQTDLRTLGFDVAPELSDQGYNLVTNAPVANQPSSVSNWLLY